MCVCVYVWCSVCVIFGFRSIFFLQFFFLAFLFFAPMIPKNKNKKKQRPSVEGEPVGKCGAVGDEDEAVTEIGGVPLAGGAYGARYQGGGVGESRGEGEGVL